MAMNRQANVAGINQKATNDPFAYAKGGPGQRTSTPMVLGNKKPATQHVFTTPFGGGGQANQNKQFPTENQSHEEDTNFTYNFVADDPNAYQQQHDNQAYNANPGQQYSQQVPNQQNYPQQQLRGVLPKPQMREQPNYQSQQHQNQNSNGWSNDEAAVSLEEIELDSSQSSHSQYGQQQQHFRQKGPVISQPFQNMEKQVSEKGPGGQYSEEDELPLLEDLGIEIEKIKIKFKSIITQRGIKENADYDDMAGPFMVVVMFGILLMLKGKVHFGYIYGLSLTGCLAIYFIINLLSKRGQYVDLYKAISILGYSLLPFCILAMIAIFADLHNIVGGVACFLIITWSTVTATRYFEYGLDMEDKKYLIAYPISLFYFVFMLLTVF